MPPKGRNARRGRLDTSLSFLRRFAHHPGLQATSHKEDQHMDRWFILDDDNNVAHATITEASEFLALSERRKVGYDEVDGYSISTVFLCLDHDYSGHNPQLFETLVSGPDVDSDIIGRYATWAQARRAHLACVGRIHLMRKAAEGGTASQRRVIPDWRD
jgi:hypothetical protein